MDYIINPAAFSAVLPIPAAVADRHLKLARGEHVKVLLYLLKNSAAEPSPAEIAGATDVSEYEVNEALLYWADAGILLPKKNETPVTEQKKTGTVRRSAKPPRADAARRGLEDGKIRYLLQETQMKLGRCLKTNETETLVWLYDDEGLDVSLILMIVQYAVAHGKANLRFIEATAVDWLNKGIDSVAAADEELRKMTMGEQAWAIVQNAFGLEKRKPSRKETELSLLWVDEWKLPRELLTCAYEACVDAKSRFSMPYVAKILEKWHEKGVRSPQDIPEGGGKARKKEDYAAYDLTLFEKMLNTKD